MVAKLFSSLFEFRFHRQLVSPYVEIDVCRIIEKLQMLERTCPSSLNIRVKNRAREIDNSGCPSIRKNPLS
jgi:hypothetical protein